MWVCLNVDHNCVARFQYGSQTPRNKHLPWFLDELPASGVNTHLQRGSHDAQLSLALYQLLLPEPWAQLEYYYSRFPGIPAHCGKFRICGYRTNRSPQLRCVQATRAYLWPKLHLIGGDHPTLQFHPKTTRSNEISQNMWEELPFSFMIWMMVESTLEWYDHCHYTAFRHICKKNLVEHPIRSSAKLTYYILQSLVVSLKFTHYSIQCVLIGCLHMIISHLPFMCVQQCLSFSYQSMTQDLRRVTCLKWFDWSANTLVVMIKLSNPLILVEQ